MARAAGNRIDIMIKFFTIMMLFHNMSAAAEKETSPGRGSMTIGDFGIYDTPLATALRPGSTIPNRVFRWR